MVAQVQFSDRDGIDDLHWRLAHASIEAMRVQLESHLRKQGVRIREDREDIIHETLPKLKRAFDSECLLSETDLISGRPQFVCAKISLMRVASLVWKILKQSRCDFHKKPANRLRCAGSSCVEYVEACAGPEAACLGDLLECSGLDNTDRRIVKLLLAGECQKSIARIIGVDPSTVSRHVEQIRRAIIEN